MKIAFEAQLLMEKEKTGIGWVADNLVRELINLSQDEYVLNYFLLPNRVKDYGLVMDKYGELGFQLNRCAWFHYVLYKMMWNFLPVPYSLFFGGKSDVTLFFNFYIPPGVKGKKITIVHDMAYKAFTETVRKKTMAMLTLNMEKSCKRANKIIAVSEFTKKEILKYIDVCPDKIVVVPNGINLEKFSTLISQDNIREIKRKYKIEREYFLYLGTLEPRKNIVRMIEAYSMLKGERAEIPQLVLAGRKGWMYDEIFETVFTLGLKEDIIFTGYVENGDEPLLMKGALVFLFPSLYEGFGLPPLEAMACGTPVIVADAASLPEVVGDAGIKVDPYSVVGLKEAMIELLDNEGLRSSLAEKGIERAKQFTWKRSAEILLDTFQELMQT